MRYPIFQNPTNAEKAVVTLIDIPFWKCSHECYLDILLLTNLDVCDYPFEIGPYPSPLSWVSYMDSTLQLCLISTHLIISNFITSNHIQFHHNMYLVFI